jgi:hypothetical protein
MVVSSQRAHAIFEDDIEALGTPLDTAYAIERCELNHCSLAYLGTALRNPFLLTHAYFISPPAAALLLKATRDHCNPRGIDYAMRDLCMSRLAHGFNCTLPPRGLIAKGERKVGELGWGLFVQNTRAVPSYNSLLGNGWGGASNWSITSAEHFQRC